MTTSTKNTELSSPSISAESERLSAEFIAMADKDPVQAANTLIEKIQNRGNMPLWAFERPAHHVQKNLIGEHPALNLKLEEVLQAEEAIDQEKGATAIAEMRLDLS